MPSRSGEGVSGNTDKAALHGAIVINVREAIPRWRGKQSPVLRTVNQARKERKSRQARKPGCIIERAPVPVQHHSQFLGEVIPAQGSACWCGQIWRAAYPAMLPQHLLAGIAPRLLKSLGMCRQTQASWPGRRQANLGSRGAAPRIGIRKTKPRHSCISHTQVL